MMSSKTPQYQNTAWGVSLHCRKFMMIVFFAKYLSAVKANEVMDRAQTGSGVQIVLV